MKLFQRMRSCKDLLFWFYIIYFLSKIFNRSFKEFLWRYFEEWNLMKIFTKDLRIIFILLKIFDEELHIFIIFFLKIFCLWVILILWPFYSVQERSGTVIKLKRCWTLYGRKSHGVRKHDNGMVMVMEKNNSISSVIKRLEKYSIFSVFISTLIVMRRNRTAKKA